MKRTIIISLLCLLCGGAMQAQKIRIKTGIEVLKEQNFRCLEGKRVGLITNPTGVDNSAVNQRKAVYLAVFFIRSG